MPQNAPSTRANPKGGNYQFAKKYSISPDRSRVKAVDKSKAGSEKDLEKIGIEHDTTVGGVTGPEDRDTLTYTAEFKRNWRKKNPGKKGPWE